MVPCRLCSKCKIKDCIADAFLQNTLLIPEEYSVVATLNLNGDYISDQLAAMVGGIGIAPGANINYNTGHAIFEATHGKMPTPPCQANDRTTTDKPLPQNQNVSP